MSFSNLIHRHINEQHKFTESQGSGFCATCACKIDGVAVEKEQLQGEAFSRNSDFLKFGNYVCLDCAWMYSYPKITHRNVLACNDWCLWPMISHDTATEERPSWLNALQLFASFDKEAEAVGVLTTDPKPRLWPMTNTVTRDDFGMYIHAPDYNTSSFVSFSLDECLDDCVPLIMKAMELKFSKRAIYNGLLGDFNKAKKDLCGIMALEKEIAKIRSSNAFLPALMASGQRKDGEALDVKPPKETSFDHPPKQSTITKQASVNKQQTQGNLF